MYRWQFYSLLSCSSDGSDLQASNICRNLNQLPAAEKDHLSVSIPTNVGQGFRCSTKNVVNC